MEGFLNIQNLGNSSRHSGRQTASRNTMLLWATKFFLWKPNETLHRMTKQRGQWEEYLQLTVFPSQESGGKCICNAKPEFSNLSEDPTTIAGECGQQYFATCILHNYLRYQGVRLSHMGSSANVRSNLINIPNQGESSHQSTFEVSKKFEQLYSIWMCALAEWKSVMSG